MTEQNKIEILGEGDTFKIWEVEERALIAEMRDCDDAENRERILLVIGDIKKDQGQNLSDS